MQGSVRPVQQICSTCGGGPWYPRTENNTDRITGDIVVEAVWVCGRCGCKFASGIIETIKKPIDEKK